MNKSFCLLLVSILFYGCFSSKTNEINYSKKLVGTWTYIESRDEAGNKIKPNDKRVLMNEPNLIYNADFTYQKIFTPRNSDFGKWKYNPKTMVLRYDLFIDSTDFIGKNLIKKGLAKKQKDGKYYETLSAKIAKLTEDEMSVESYGSFLIYRKEKQDVPN